MGKKRTIDIEWARDLVEFWGASADADRAVVNEAPEGSSPKASIPCAEDIERSVIPERIFVRFGVSAYGVTIRKWSFDPFPGSIMFRSVGEGKDGQA